MGFGTGIGLTLGLALTTVVGYFGYTTSRLHYESAPYTVTSQSGDYEIRDYPALTVVETLTPDGDSQGFRRLFNFISGSNEKKEKIPMTTPVFFSVHNSSNAVAFVMPKDMKPELVPKPSTGLVEVSEYPAGKFAVLRFDGNLDRKDSDFNKIESENIDKLRKWVGTTEQIDEDQEPIWSVFDAPWTPGFWRRNELMIRLK